MKNLNLTCFDTSNSPIALRFRCCRIFYNCVTANYLENTSEKNYKVCQDFMELDKKNLVVFSTHDH